MAKRTRRTQRRPATPERTRGRFPSAGVVLATLSTVVAVATGMFTLRDHIFPREAGTAAAVSVPAFQSEVGEVCDELNVNDRRRARDDKAIRRKLPRAETTLAQRNLLLDGVRRSATRSGHALASFAGLTTPEGLEGVRRETEAVWNRNLDRLREYAMRLDRAGTRRRMIVAVDQLAKQRPAIGHDGDRVRSGLERLGAESCDLEPSIVTSSYTVPPVRREQEDDAVTPAVNAPPADAPAREGPAADPPPVTGDGTTPGANTPSAPAPPRANLPGDTGATGGGGED